LKKENERMGFIQDFINFLLHLDQYLNILIQTFGVWTYVILFLVVFAETGLVVAPFFPGDSLIFISGALAQTGILNAILLFIVFTVAAIIGDTVNYWIGHFFGEKFFKKQSRFFKIEYLKRTKDFYTKHGGKTIILARFIPIIRTFAPFVAGIGKMKYKKFISYNIIGGVAWVLLFLLAGYFFGSIPIVKNNLSISIYLIIFISLIPAAYEIAKHYLKKIKSKNK
jgi:membrane-associated protein